MGFSLVRLKISPVLFPFILYIASFVKHGWYTILSFNKKNKVGEGKRCGSKVGYIKCAFNSSTSGNLEAGSKQIM